jgi:5-formyltetrahydrofolate cyclo-ligase
VRQLRRAVPRADRRRAARQAALHLARVARACSARHVAAYLSLPEEIDTAPLIALLRRQRCVLYVPKLAGAGRLRFMRLDTAMRRNRYGIAEPVAGGRPPRLDLIVLPLVAFDEAGRRLGMGGGYYDRLLARPRPWRRPLRIGLAFAAQQVAAVPANARDARLDAVVTERGLRRF